MANDESFAATRTLDRDALGESPSRVSVTTLVFHGRFGAEVLKLADGSSVLVGRGAPADLILDDPSLSRSHARITANAAGVWIEDTASKNGTRLDGVPVQAVQVRPGAKLELGAVLVVVSDSTGDDAGFQEYERFISHVEAEAVRARLLGRALSVAVVRSGVGGSTAAWASRVRAELRPGDFAARFGLDAIVVLLLDLDLEQAMRTAYALVRARPDEPPLFCGVASAHAGASGASLVEAAKHACREASPERACVAVDPRPETEDAGRPVVVDGAMHAIFQLARRAALHSAPVLVLGDTGTGKELVARTVHDAGPRREGPFKAINCGAIPPTLAENVLFGHERGAFTGADRPTKGLFEEAQGGTVFLDEVGELPLSAQASLLRAIETRVVCRLGSTRETEIDVRLVAATHCDLEAMIAAKTFRADLFHRLNLLTIWVPRLRDRPGDILPLAAHFIERARIEWRGSITGIDPAARDALLRYEWPGNVRELRNVIERAALVAGGTLVTLEDLPESMRRVDCQPTQTQTQTQTQASFAGSPDGPLGPGRDIQGPFAGSVRDYEVALLERALERAGGNQTKAAKLLEMPLRTLVHKIRTYGLQPAKRRPGDPPLRRS